MRLPRSYIDKFPHELSDGERQRRAVARALAPNPKFIVLDEPASSLDVSVQANILNILKDLQEEFGLSYLFISHNLSVIQFMSQRIYVMYAGKLVEVATREELFRSPEHPYTQALLSATPIPNPELSKKRIILKGEPPSLVNPPPSCRFHPRCPYKQPTCSTKEPTLVDIGRGHSVACHLKS